MKDRRGRRRWRGRAELPAVSLSPDEWIASLVARDQSPATGTTRSSGSGADSPPAMGGNGHASRVDVAAGPATVNGRGPNESALTDPPAGRSEAEPETSRRTGTWRTILVAVAAFVLSVAMGLVGFVAVAGLDARRDLAGAGSRLEQLSSRVTALTAERDRLRSEVAGTDARLSQVQSELSAALGELDRVRESKKVVVTREVPVTTPVPNGREISVETTGFEEVVEVFDVHLTHAYGFSDLVGIAKNNSEETIAYVQIGCTFLDGKGRVLANVIDNRENWAPGATWGFDCSAEVDATGGIVRVDVAE